LNLYSVKRTSGRDRLESQVKRALTFDPTVGSCSKV
jgi:hypothetical protein